MCRLLLIAKCKSFRFRGAHTMQFFLKVNLLVIKLLWNGVLVAFCTLYYPWQDPFQVTGVSLAKATREGAPSLCVTWTAPQHNVNISAYDVQYKIEGSNQWSNQITTSGSASKACVISLKPGTEYNVRVKARFSDGNIGGWSLGTTERTYDSEWHNLHS